MTRAPRAGSPAHDEILELQREAGNGAVARWLGAGPGPSPTPHTRVAVQRQPNQEPRTAENAGAKADTATRGKKIPGQPPKLPDPEEASYRTKGESKLADLGGALSSTAAGHTTVGPIEGFPDWFANLQSALIGSSQWRTDKEETAQNLLADYALKRFAIEHGGDTTKVPPTVRIFLERIGRSTSNVDAATAAKLPNSGELGGSQNAKNWCAQAGSSSVLLALKAAGLGIDTAKMTENEWLKSPPSVPKVGMPQITVDSKIEPGDQVSYVEAAIKAIGGHTVTALSDSSGDATTFEHASGNAGGGTSGSVRLGSSPPRAGIPAKVRFEDITEKTAADLGAPSGRIWVYVIVKYSRFWADLGAIETAAPNVWQSTTGQAFLTKYKLKVAPGRKP
jgi:hypothetical protein